MTATLAVQNSGEAAVFWICGALAVLGALGMLFSRKAVHSALFLAMTMINLAIIYVSLSAPFLGMVQVIVYTGAIMMLFLFVLMVVGVDSSDSLVETVKGQRPAAILFGLGFAVLLLGLLGSGTSDLPAGSLADANAAAGGNVQGIAQLIFTQYVFAFEVTSALLITAALGAMILTHREHITPKPTQRERSEARFRSGHPSPLPPPGTYARHNAVDTPALLPDGSAAEISVPRPMALRHSEVDRVDVDEVDEVAHQRNVVVDELQHGQADDGEER
ncbi:MAG: NADH-quinone oxidoreductase subunit J [Candidatus Nanopelagicales bacterium]